MSSVENRAREREVCATASRIETKALKGWRHRPGLTPARLPRWLPSQPAEPGSRLQPAWAVQGGIDCLQQPMAISADM